MKVTKLDELGGRLLSGDLVTGLGLLESSRQEVLSEHRRRAANEDDYYSWFLQDLVGRASGGDQQAQAVISALIEEKSFLNETDWDGAFSFASMLAFNGLLDLLRKAVAAGAEINIGKYPALTAVLFPRELPENWIEISDFLLANGAKVNGTGSEKPPLFEAMTDKKFEAIPYLVARGADLNQRHAFYADGNQLGTALHFAALKVSQGELKASAFEQLVELGAEPATPNQEWQGAYQYLKAQSDDLRDSASEEFAKVMKFLSSREEWRETPPFTCPKCAEKVKYEAKECRFCGQVLNKAVKRGFPEFYVEALVDLDLWRLKYDYIKHANPDFNGSITAPSILGNLFSYGELDEYYEYQPVIDAMRAREAVLAGGDPESTPGHPDRTPNYWKEANREQQALYLTRRYLEIAQQYTKTFGDRDLRQDPDNMDWAIGEFRKLIDLAEQTDLSTEEYADHFRGEIDRCTEQRVKALQGQKSLSGNTSTFDGLRAGSRSENSPSAEKKPNVFLWITVGIAILVALGTFA